MHDTPINQDLVLVGGGHAHVEVLRRFGMRRMAGVRLTLISREVHTPYSGMLPGLIAGHYSFDEAHIDLGPLARFAGARLYHDEVTGIDLPHKRVFCRTRPPVAFDILSIDTGAAPSHAVPGAAEYAVPVKPVSNFHQRWQALRARVREARAAVRIGVVGGGAGGVELLMAARHCLLEDVAGAGAPELRFHLLTASDDILPTHNARARAVYRRLMQRAGVQLHTACTVTQLCAGAVLSASGDVIALDEVLWVTTAAAPTWPADSGLATDEQGFIRVDACLQSISHACVFAAGDIAEVDPHPRPKSGVFAVRQGPPLTANLRHALAGEALEPFTPQRSGLSLISAGERYAVASRGPLACAGRWVWRWKDHIDRGFMQRYADLPQMAAMTHTPDDPAAPAGEASHGAMRCGGCGAKIGAELLQQALAALAPSPREDIVIGLAAPDDAAVVRLPAGMVGVHTVDAFRSFIDDPWLFGRITANHCLGDIFAMGASPQTALAIATLPLAHERKMQDDLVQMMTGALALFAAERTALVGGHTTEGAELALGFAVNGYVDERRLLRKTGARAGHALVLTKPLGSGVLLAAAMRGKAKSRWLDAALASMSQSHGASQLCLMQHGAAAMTDVTGFGLAGHLLEMLADGSIGAAVDLRALPVFEGAAGLAHAGLLSSLQPQNLRALAAMRVSDAARAHAHFELCFDPQTAGGLLAALPIEEAEICVRTLRASGYPLAAVIGRITPAEPGAIITLEA